MEFIIIGIIAVALTAAVVKKIKDIKRGNCCGCSECNCKEKGRCGK